MVCLELRRVCETKRDSKKQSFINVHVRDKERETKTREGKEKDAYVFMWE